MNDFLEAPKAFPIPGLVSAFEKGFSQQALLLEDIRRELMKTHPDVLAITRLQGTNVPNGDDTSKRVFFELGGKPVTVHRILAWTNGNTPVSLSINSMLSVDDGIVVGITPLVLDISVDSLWIITDGSDDLFVNQPNAAEDTVWIYGFTIPDYDRRKDFPVSYAMAEA